MTTLAHIANLFAAQPDEEAALKLCERICEHLHKSIRADLAMIFQVKLFADGTLQFVPFAVYDDKGKRPYPNAPIDRGLLGVAYRQRRSVLVRDIRRKLQTSLSLSDEMSGEELPMSSYNNFNQTTDENLVVPLLASDNRYASVCAMLNLERTASAHPASHPWTPVLVGELEERFRNIGHIVGSAMADQERRTTTRDLVSSHLAAVLADSGRPSANAAQPGIRGQQAEVVVVCALEDERDQVMDAFARCLHVSHDGFRRLNLSGMEHITAHRLELERPDLPPSVVVASPRRMGLTYAGIVTTQLLACLRPRLAVMCGIAGGADPSHSLGDVLVARTATPYRMGRINADGSLHRDGPTEDERVDRVLDPMLEDHVRTFYGDQPHDPFNVRSSRRVQARYGAIGSADQVLDDADAVISLRECVARKLLGVEMEISAFYAACAVAPSPRPLYFACKAISDFPGQKLGSDAATPNNRLDAAYISGWFAASFLRTKWPALRGP